MIGSTFIVILLKKVDFSLKIFSRAVFTIYKRSSTKYSIKQILYKKGESKVVSEFAMLAQKRG